VPTRATKRGGERTRLDVDCDVLICGASFAGLAAARELNGTGADVLVIDRYEIGERQTSACGIPTGWLEALDLQASLRQTFGELVIHTPAATVNYRLPWTFSTFDYRTLCQLLADQGGFRFETAKVEGKSAGASGKSACADFLASSAGASGKSAGADFLASSAGAELEGRTHTVHTDRGDIRATHVVDALGWRRVLGAGQNIQPPDALLSRGLEVHPDGSGTEMEIWIDRSYVPAGYGWSFPAGEELRIGVGSFDPRFHVREPTERLATDLETPAVRYQGNWIPHALRAATEDGVFFAGDSAGHCLPLTAEGIRTALYFGLAVGRALRDCLAGQTTVADALSGYARFSASHARAYRWMLRVQRLIPRVAPRLLARSLRAMENQRFIDWAFGHYLEIAHPRFVAAGPPRARVQVAGP
jgi:flavin-dependent dehydrogenase